MSMFGESGFNSQATENNVSNVVPKGDYQAIIVDSKKVETKDGEGAYLKLTWQILSGDQQNKKIFENVNLWLKEDTDKRRTAVGIAKSHLSRICRAVNVLNPKESFELHSKPCTISVGVRDNGEFGMQNTVTNVKPRSSAAAPTPPMAPQVPATAGAGAGNDPFA